MASKSNNTQTLVIGLSFLAVGLILGLMLANKVVVDSQSTESNETVNVEQLETVSVSEDDDASIGSDDAPVTIIEFSDFQCYWCGRFHADTLPSLLKNYVDAGIVRLVIRDFPAGSHPEAKLAAQSAECVRAYTMEEDPDLAYFEMHDLLFNNQTAWSGKSDAKEQLIALAKDNLDVDIKNCLDTEEMQAEVEADYVAGRSYGIGGTPTFFVNGKKLVGAWPYETFETVIKALR
ncbi:DsbA family protein [Candidatus Peregrinibacteria bacterium]|nr:MAG: DsbA family protein [Candidatus Peregrinibacteria bacterium]